MQPIIDYPPIFLRNVTFFTLHVRAGAAARSDRRFHKNSLQIGDRYVDTQTRHAKNRSDAPSGGAPPFAADYARASKKIGLWEGCAWTERVILGAKRRRNTREEAESERYSFRRRGLEIGQLSAKLYIGEGRLSSPEWQLNFYICRARSERHGKNCRTSLSHGLLCHPFSFSLFYSFEFARDGRHQDISEKCHLSGATHLYLLRDRLSLFAMTFHIIFTLIHILFYYYVIYDVAKMYLNQCWISELDNIFY